jgi:hypothetical protein
VGQACRSVRAGRSSCCPWALCSPASSRSGARPTGEAASRRNRRASLSRRLAPRSLSASAPFRRSKPSWGRVGPVPHCRAVSRSRRQRASCRRRHPPLTRQEPLSPQRRRLLRPRRRRKKLPRSTSGRPLPLLRHRPADRREAAVGAPSLPRAAVARSKAPAEMDERLPPPIFRHRRLAPRRRRDPWLSGRA